MKKITAQSVSLSTLFSVFVAAILLTIIIFFSIQIHNLRRSAIVNQLQQHTKALEINFNETINYTEHVMGYIATEIKQNGTEKNYIYGLLKSFKTASETVLPYSTLSWLDADHRLTVSSNQGIMANPANLSKRDYVSYAVRTPYRLHFGTPVYGSTSKLWSIPAGMGITDHQGKYLGIIVTGFVVEGLTKKLEHIISQQGVEFLLFDKNLSLITTSPGIRSNNIFIHSIQKKVAAQNKTAGYSAPLFVPSFWRRESEFSYYTVMEKYPYIIVTTYDPALNSEFITQAVLEFMIKCAVIATLIIALLYAIRRLLVAPIIRISAVADNIARGELDTPIPSFYSVEINNLATQLENIKEDKQKLKLAHKELQCAKATLESKVIERTSELQKALQAKTEFLNNVNHELRTPVHGVMNFSDILVTDWNRYDDKMRLKLASDIYSSSQRLYSLITNLLDLSKYQEGKMIITPAEADLTSVVAAVIHDCRPLYFNKKDITLVLENPDVPMVGIFDKDRIMQVVRNLVSNAIKYSNSGTITARISRVVFKQGRKKRTGLQFSLSDQGKGVPENELEDIFIPFIQSSLTRTGAGGTGLGLSISKEIIEGHQGKIWAECNPEGNGMVFSFIIPV
jgi:two-component system, sensor histidine kinase ChiS